jgi:formylglycine-generating enzyme required for sulfatase activity
VVLSTLLVLPGWIEGTMLAPAPMRKKLPKRISNSIGMKLVLIPAGKFQMGSPRDDKDRGENEEQHEVEITKAFYLGVYEVTQGQFKKVTGKNPSHFSKEGNASRMREWDSTDDFPVEGVTWHAAVDFCKRLSAFPAEKKAGRVYRLPTEAEWEYACRAGASSYRVFHCGNRLSSRQANVDAMNGPGGSGNPRDYLFRTTRVGSYKPNAWGLYDMHGNVREWCQDWYGKDYYKNSPRKDPKGPDRGEDRVLRSSSWGDIPENCRSASRSRGDPNRALAGEGFRVVCSLAGGTP